MNPTWVVIGGTLFFIMSIVLLFSSFYDSKGIRRAIENGAVKGCVAFTTYQTTRESDGDIKNKKIEIFEFTTKDGQTIQGKPSSTKSTTLGNAWRVRDDEEVDIYYDPEKPERFIVPEGSNLTLAVYSPIIFGIAFFIFGLVMMKLAVLPNISL